MSRSCALTIAISRRHGRNPHVLLGARLPAAGGAWKETGGITPGCQGHFTRRPTAHADAQEPACSHAVEILLLPFLFADDDQHAVAPRQDVLNGAAVSGTQLLFHPSLHTVV